MEQLLNIWEFLNKSPIKDFGTPTSNFIFAIVTILLTTTSIAIFISTIIESILGIKGPARAFLSKIDYDVKNWNGYFVTFGLLLQVLVTIMIILILMLLIPALCYIWLPLSIITAFVGVLFLIKYSKPLINSIKNIQITPVQILTLKYVAGICTAIISYIISWHILINTGEMCAIGDGRYGQTLFLSLFVEITLALLVYIIDWLAYGIKESYRKAKAKSPKKPTTTIYDPRLQVQSTVPQEDKSITNYKDSLRN